MLAVAVLVIDMSGLLWLRQGETGLPWYRRRRYCHSRLCFYFCCSGCRRRKSGCRSDSRTRRNRGGGRAKTSATRRGHCCDWVKPRPVLRPKHTGRLPNQRARERVPAVTDQRAPDQRPCMMGHCKVAEDLDQDLGGKVGVDGVGGRGRKSLSGRSGVC